MANNDPSNNRITTMHDPGNDEMQDESEYYDQQAQEQVLRPQSVTKASVNKKTKKNVQFNPSGIASTVKNRHAAKATGSDINQIQGFMQGMRLDKNLTNMR